MQSVYSEYLLSDDVSHVRLCVPESLSTAVFLVFLSMGPVH